MATFKAYNIDYDSSESEADDTKELQIEEAIKLYQTAIKYQSEGPPSFKKTTQAYKELFASEIFGYPESLSELNRSEKFPEYDDLLQEHLLPAPQPLVLTTGGSTNALPQIIHLAYKNHGLFLLDTLKHELNTNSIDPDDIREVIADDVSEPLGDFALALDKDEADTDLWRRTATTATLAGSYRIAKFCLESVFDADPLRSDSIGLDETLAAQQLYTLLNDLQDDFAISTFDFAPQRQRALIHALSRLLDLYPSIPKPTFKEAALSAVGTAGSKPKPVVISLEKDYSWAGVAKAIMEHFKQEQGIGQKKGPKDFGPGSALKFRRPGNRDALSEPPSPVIKRHTDPELDLLIQEQLQQETAENLKSQAESLIKQENNKVALMSPSNDVTVDATADAVVEENEVDNVEDNNNESARKRSPDEAGLAEGGRGRSKRTRRSNVHGIKEPESTIPETSKEELLQRYNDADDLSFQFMEKLLAKLNVNKVIKPKILRSLCSDTDNSRNEISQKTALQDVYRMLKNCNAFTYDVLVNWNVNRISAVSKEAGLSAFLGRETGSSFRSLVKSPLPPNYLLDKWLDSIENTWVPLSETVWSFIKMFTMPMENSTESLYMSYVWPFDLRTEIWNLITVFDESIFNNVQHELEIVRKRSYDNNSSIETKDLLHILDLVQTLFEIHVDIQSWMISPTTSIEPSQERLHWERTKRWALMANSAMRFLGSNYESITDIQIRHVWTQITLIGIDATVTQQEKIICTKQLQGFFESEHIHKSIQLPNNVTSSEISLSIVLARLQRMNMKGFFLKVFEQDEKNPVAIIELLEPLLESIRVSDADVDVDTSQDTVMDSDSPEILSDQSPELSKMIASGGIALQLPLWRLLREAYESITYPPKVVSCDLRTIELLVNDVNSKAFTDLDKTQRYNLLPQWLVLIDDCIGRVISRRDIPNFLEHIDEEHVESSMCALSQYCNLLHMAILLDDMSRTNQIPQPTVEGRGTRYSTLASKFNDMEIRAWVLQYFLFKEGSQQQPSEKLDDFTEDQLTFIRAVHHPLGTRGTCKAGQKLWLKVARDDLYDLVEMNDAKDELVQVLHDLHGLNCFTDRWAEIDHGDPDTEPLTKKSATRLLPFLISRTNELTKKDPPRAELKASLEKAQSALGRPKTLEVTATNRKICVAYIKGPVNPLNLAACFRGTFLLNIKKVPTELAPISASGWYFLAGHMALQKYKSQKRLLQPNSEDLNTAASQFLLDLDFHTENWESWYRLGQVYDAQVDEAVTWTAEKLNAQSNDFNNLQRAAINCYAMAISCYNRQMTDEDEDNIVTSKLCGELYSDFAMRMYSSSREPFSMAPFMIRESEERHFSRDDPMETYMYKKASFRMFKAIDAIRTAAQLFQNAIDHKSGYWQNHYMLGKCLWKLYNCDEFAEDDSAPRPKMATILRCFTLAIENLPRSRDSRKEPILEPHYKLVVIVHKLFLKGDLKFDKAIELLQMSTYVKKCPLPEEEKDWNSYMLRVLKALRSADKAGWHHRMIMRTAKILCDEDNMSVEAANSAKAELFASGSIFTKLLNIQVWKPEYERPGRHFVYTSRYVHYVFGLLYKTNDRSQAGLLLRKIVKKKSEYYDHKELWREECTRYLKMLCQWASIPEQQDDSRFKLMFQDDFAKEADKLEQWAIDKKQQNETLELLREAVEFKKVNNSYMKGPLFEDVEIEIYSKLFTDVLPTLPGLSIENNKMDTIVSEKLNVAPVPTISTSKTRRQGISRLELKKRAEAAGIALSTTVTQNVPIRQLKGDLSSSSSTNGEKLNSIQLARRTSFRQKDGAVDADVDADADADADEGTNRSIHDSADDESELSELEDSAELEAYKTLNIPTTVEDDNEDKDEGVNVDGEDDVSKMEVDT